MGSSSSRSAAASSSSSTNQWTEPAKVQRHNLDRRYSKKYSFISDQYQNLEQVQNALREAGLESSNLILGIDFTKSNEWTGKHSFKGRSLHAIGDIPNPYEQAMKIIGQTLSVFDDDNLIPCFGFGDATTHDHYVFSFLQDNQPCNGFEHALERYRQVVPNLKLAGPTSFAPMIEAAIQVVEESEGQYHVLVIVADGQVTRSVDTEPGNLSSQEQATIDALVAASDYPLSIILVGVGDGPWDMMRQFDDNIPARAFDNFQFVNFSEIMQRNMSDEQREARFALGALMEIPAQYKATMELKLLGTNRRRTGAERGRGPLPPPPAVLQADGYAAQMGQYESGKPFASRGEVGRLPHQHYPGNVEAKYSSTQPRSPYASQAPYGAPQVYPPQAGPAAKRSKDNITDNQQQLCQVCMSDRKDTAFGCGHQTCGNCAKSLENCPYCREKISTRIRLY